MSQPTERPRVMKVLVRSHLVMIVPVEMRKVLRESRLMKTLKENCPVDIGNPPTKDSAANPLTRMPTGSPLLMEALTENFHKLSPVLSIEQVGVLLDNLVRPVLQVRWWGPTGIWRRMGTRCHGTDLMAG